MSWINTPQALKIMVAHLLRSKEILTQTCSLIKPSDFNHAGELPYKFLWAISKAWFEQHHTPITIDYLAAELGKWLNDNQFLSNDEINNLPGLVAELYSIPLNHVEAKKYIEDFLENRRIRPNIDKIKQSEYGLEFSEELTKLLKEYSQTRISVAKDVSYMFTPDGIDIPFESKKSPTHVAPVDFLTGGGIAPGEVYGLMGPTGSGKTTLAIQLLCEIAKNLNDAVYLSYECTVEREIQSRVYSYLGGIPRSVFISETEWTKQANPANVKLLKQLLGNCGKHIIVRDMMPKPDNPAGKGWVPELSTELQRIKDAGQAPRIVIIDQMSTFINNYLLAQNKNLTEARNYMAATIQQLRVLAQPSVFNCSIIMLHQVDNTVKRMGPMRKPQPGDAAEFKAFENDLHCLVQLGTRDQNYRCWLSNPKGRDSQRKDIIVEGDPNIWRINWEPDRFVAGDTCFIDTKANENEYSFQSESEIDKLKDS